jgi:hypothetical protein
MHYSMTLYPDNPIVEIGDLVRLLAPGEWRTVDGGTVIVPAGTEGEVRYWATNLGTGTAFDFYPFNHPDHKLFPMTMHRAGVSRYSDKFQLIRRASEAA